MKKISAVLLFLLMVFSLSAVYASEETIEAAFPDEAFRHIVCTKTGISDISDSLEKWKEPISQIKEISAANSGIKSLEGIEYFASLELLDVSENEIEKLDLTKNTNLKYLFVFDNNIRSLDLSANKSLQQVYAQNCDLENIVIPSNVTKLYVQGNSLKEFSSEDAVNLKELNIKNNLLKALGISENKSLEYLWTGENRLYNILINPSAKFSIIDLGKQIFSVGLKDRNATLIFDSLWEVVSMNKEDNDGKFTFSAKELPFDLEGIISVSGHNMNISAKLTDMRADLDDSGTINSDDLSAILSAYGTDNPSCDVNGDGIVNSADLSLVLSCYGISADY